MKLRDVLCCEMVGKHVKVIEAENQALIGIEGEVVDETQQTLVLKQGKKLLKSQVKLEINIRDQKIIVDGKALVGRPEDRIKRK